MRNKKCEAVFSNSSDNGGNKRYVDRGTQKPLKLSCTVNAAGSRDVIDLAMCALRDTAQRQAGDLSVYTA